MRKALFVSLTVLALGVAPSFAQDSGRGGPMLDEGGGNAGTPPRNNANRPARPNRPPLDLTATPPACEAAYTPSSAPTATPTQSDAAVPTAIGRMRDLMTKAATIKNPDLAYNCAMIAHNQGAIALAQEEVRAGQDIVTKKIAERTVKVRGNEIRRMQRFVNRIAHPKKI